MSTYCGPRVTHNLNPTPNWYQPFGPEWWRHPHVNSNTVHRKHNNSSFVLSLLVFVLFWENQQQHVGYYLLENCRSFLFAGKKEEKRAKGKERRGGMNGSCREDCRLSVGIASAYGASRRFDKGKRGITKRLFEGFLLLYLSNKRKKSHSLRQEHSKRAPSLSLLFFGDIVRVSVRRPYYQREHY